MHGFSHTTSGGYCLGISWDFFLLLTFCFVLWGSVGRCGVGDRVYITQHSLFSSKPGPGPGPAEKSYTMCLRPLQQDQETVHTDRQLRLPNNTTPAAIHFSLSRILVTVSPVVAGFPLSLAWGDSWYAGSFASSPSRQLCLCVIVRST